MIFDRNTINKQGIVSYILVPAIIIRNYPNNSSSPLVQREFLAASLLLAAGSTANPRLTLSLLTAASTTTTATTANTGMCWRSISLFFLYSLSFPVSYLCLLDLRRRFFCSVAAAVTLAVIQSGPTPGRTAHWWLLTPLLLTSIVLLYCYSILFSLLSCY